MEQINIKLTSEIKSLFQNVYEELKSSGEVSTLNEYIELLVERFQNPPKRYINSPEVSIELTNARNTIKELRIEISEIRDKYQQQVDIITNEIILLRNKKPEYIEVPVEIERLIEKELSENQLVINIPTCTKVLLFETANRLSKKYNKVISAESILLNMFMRYTVEQYNQWFYPFVISSNEIEKLTGYSNREINKIITLT
jgi:hypothetical protein